MHPIRRPGRGPGRIAHATTGLVLALAAVTVLAGCETGAPLATPTVTPGTSTEPREVNVIARDYAYVPPVIDLVPGETVVLHVVNGGLATHEAVVGSLADQLAWEAAEAPHADPPPGPTPSVEEPAGWDGVRVVAGSGQRVDVVWTVPAGAATDPGGWFVGCHIPGHWEKGMVVPVRFLDEAGVPMGTPPAIPSGSAGG